MQSTLAGIQNHISHITAPFIIQLLLFFLLVRGNSFLLRAANRAKHLPISQQPGNVLLLTLFTAPKVRAATQELNRDYERALTQTSHNKNTQYRTSQNVQDIMK